LDHKVQCNLCEHRCTIADGNLGICNVRKNIKGILYSLVYGKTISQHVDPIEKKPLYHFFPGSTAYSIATPGCNFRCQWCQNWEIAQMPREFGKIEGDEVSPQEIIDEVISSHSQSIAYTYTEPTIFFEFTFDIARLAKENGIANVYVTNGYMSNEMLDMFNPYLNAANVDLKSFNELTYKRLAGAKLQPVLDNLIRMKQDGIWVEVTTLVIPGINDDVGELRKIAKFIVQELDVGTPWHLSRFIPHYKMRNIPPTPVDRLVKGREIGKEEGLRYVYLGNVGGDTNTECHHCGKMLVNRHGYWVPKNHILNGKCPDCGVKIPGIWG
jgi:pyruvate formate lyase activating enzyme